MTNRLTPLMSSQTESPFFCADDGPRFPTIKPKDAASLILVKRSRGSIRVLMGERSRDHTFLPGRFVFPGGRLDRGDLSLSVPTDLKPEVRAKVAAGSTQAKARGLGLAAIRETFEEAGILLGQRIVNPHQTRSQGWLRFLAHGVAPQLEVLDFVARAITPPGRPRRYDARFFMADAAHIGLSLDAISIGGELLEPAWLTLDQARAANVLPITRCVLDEVEARLTDGPEHSRPVPFYFLRRNKAVVLRL